MKQDIIMNICGTIIVISLFGFVGFTFWTDYQIQKKHLEIERAKIQCQQCLEHQEILNQGGHYVR